MTQTQLSAFSKELKLTFRTNHQTPHSNHEVNSSKEECTIYILQIIKVDQQEYSIFYDTGCCNMVSRYNAIKTIGDRTVQEFHGHISIGGVDNVESKPAHLIYRVKLVFFNGNNTVFSGICLDQITLLFSKYLLQVNVEKCVRDGYQQIGGDIRNLQVVQLGGYTHHIMVGLK